MESPQAMSDFYDVGYSEPGRATELPDEKRLSELLETGFKGSEADFTYTSSILRALKVPLNGRLLDFGASWGYASWQFARVDLMSDRLKLQSQGQHLVQSSA